MLDTLFNNEIQVNPAYLIDWQDIPAEFAKELTGMIQKFTDNPEVYFEQETLHLGAILPLEEDTETFLSWDELKDMGLWFAFNYTLRDRGINILRKYGVYLSRDPVKFEPQEVDAWIQVLRRHGYKVEGLTS